MQFGHWISATTSSIMEHWAKVAGCKALCTVPSMC